MGLLCASIGDIVTELSEGVAGQAQLREDGEVRAPVLRLSHDLFGLAEVLFGVAEDAVDLGQCYPHGYLLPLSLMRSFRT